MEKVLSSIKGAIRQMKIIPLSKVCSRIVDCPHETPEWKETGIPVIRNYNLVDGHIDTSNLSFVDEETYLKRVRREVPQKDDVIFSREAPIGNCGIIPNAFKCCLGQRLVLLRANQDICTPSYLITVLQSDYVRQQIEQVSKRGSIVSNFAIEDLKELLIPIIDNQDDVAHLYTLLSDKISNNTEITVLLEKQAKLLYDYWFVQFDFPDENGKPYKSSGGKMVWNEELKRGIPDGWKVKPLSKVLCLLRDGTHNPPKRIDSGIPLLTGTMFGDYFLDYSQATYITEDDYYTIHKQYKPNAGDIVITKIGTLGNVNYLRDKDIPIAIHCNSALLRFPDDYCGMFAFQYCKSKEFFARLKAAKGQSVQEFCSLDSIGSILMLVPDHKLTARYNDNMKSVLNQMINTQSENQELASLRDFLLPMLMNGQVKVKKEDDNE